MVECLGKIRVGPSDYETYNVGQKYVPQNMCTVPKSKDIRVDVIGLSYYFYILKQE